MDEYLIPGTSVLRNIPNIRDAEQLNLYERVASRDAMMTLPPVQISEQGLRDVHRHLFRNVYEWAGQDRVTPLRQGQEIISFSPPGDIAQRLDHLFARITTEDRAGLTPQRYADALTPDLAEINAIHPFREGNGRTQRVMFEAIAQGDGQSVDFRYTTGARMAVTSSEALRGDPSELGRLLRDAMNPVQLSHLADVRVGLNRANIARQEEFDIRPLAVGERVTGELVMRTDRAALVVAPDRIASIHVSDVPRTATLGASVTVTASQEGERAKLADGYLAMRVVDRTLFPEIAAVQEKRAELFDRLMTSGAPERVADEANRIGREQIATAIRRGDDVSRIDPNTVMRQAEDSARLSQHGGIRI